MLKENGLLEILASLYIYAVNFFLSDNVRSHTSADPLIQRGGAV